MKLSKLTAAVLAIIAAGCMASCSDDDDEPTPAPEPVDINPGVYVLNNGVQTGNIPGSITTYDLTTGTTAQNAFMSANGVSLGDTPQSVVIYGSKMYINVTASNLIWVVDANSLKKITSITPPEGMSEPREFAVKDGKVYSSMYSGHVVRIDTLSLEIDRTIAVGPNPEQMAVTDDGKLYVANSDGMNWMNGNINNSMSIIDLASWTEKKVDVGYNPYKMVSNGTDVFLICMGNYADIPATVKKINGETATDFCPGTLMDIRDNELYVINYPSDGSAKTFKVYSTADASVVRDMISEDVEAPSGIKVDSLTGNILILSYYLADYGYPLYSDPCYARLYTSAGTPIARFETGVGSIAAAFRHNLSNI